MLHTEYNVGPQSQGNLGNLQLQTLREVSKERSLPGGFSIRRPLTESVKGNSQKVSNIIESNSAENFKITMDFLYFKKMMVTIDHTADIMELIKGIEMTGNINFMSKSNSWTALMFAALYNNEDIIKALLAMGARKGLTNSKGESAFDIAKKSSASEEVKTLLNKASFRKLYFFDRQFLGNLTQIVVQVLSEEESINICHLCIFAIMLEKYDQIQFHHAFQDSTYLSLKSLSLRLSGITQILFI